MVATYSSAVDWVAVAPRTLNYTSIGAMGLDSSHGLGLALGRPDKRVVVLQGDGSAADESRQSGDDRRRGAEEPCALRRAERDLRGQRQPSDSESASRFRQRWRKSSGYAATYDFSDLRIFEQQVAHVLEQQGPVFATLHVEPTKPLKYDYPSLYDPKKRKAFKNVWSA